MGTRRKDIELKGDHLPDGAGRITGQGSAYKPTMFVQTTGAASAHINLFNIS